MSGQRRRRCIRFELFNPLQRFRFESNRGPRNWDLSDALNLWNSPVKSGYQLAQFTNGLRPGLPRDTPADQRFAPWLEHSTPQIPSAVLAARNHLVDVVGQITQTKSGSVL